VIVFPVVLRASFHDLWFATFTFNQLYAGLTTMPERAHALVWMLLFAAQHGAIIPALAAFSTVVLPKRLRGHGHDDIFYVAVAWFALELVFAAYTGKLYGKNVVPWIPPAVLLTAWLARPRESSSYETVHYTGSAVVLLLTVALSITQFRENARVVNAAEDRVIAAVQSRSNPGDRVAFWGEYPTDTIYLSDRRPASRYFNSVPLLHGEAAYRVLAPGLVQDLLRNEPVLIVRRRMGSPEWDTDELRAETPELMGKYGAVWQDAETGTVIYRRR
jgi:hypothetical protein